MIFLAVFTMGCRVLWLAAKEFPNHPVRQLVRMLSAVPRLKEHMMGNWGSRSSQFAGVVEACFAFLASDAALCIQERSSVMCTPKNLVLSTAEPPIVSEGMLGVHSEITDNLHI